MALFKKLNPLSSKDASPLTDTIKISGTSGSGYSSLDYGAIPSLSTADLTLGNIAFSSGTSTTYTLGPSGSHANAVWTTAVPGTGINWNQSAVGATITPSATISLKGENADIDINGKSMKTWMEQVEERLNLLTINPKLEEEWEELRELGDRYRELEKKCKEKAEVWKKLKSMPPPETD